jgi:WD40 repeat protein
VAHIAFNPRGDSLAAFDGTGEEKDKHVLIRDAHTGKPLASLPSLNRQLCLAYAPDGTRLATAHRDGTVRIWSVKQLLGERVDE